MEMPTETAPFALAENASLSNEDSATLQADFALLDAMDFGEIFEASGKLYIKSAFKGRRWIEPVPRTASFRQRQKLRKRARQAARDQGLLT